MRPIPVVQLIGIWATSEWWLPEPNRTSDAMLDLSQPYWRKTFRFGTPQAIIEKRL